MQGDSRAERIQVEHVTKHLLEAVTKWLKDELDKGERLLGSAEWVKGTDGDLYIRYISRLSRIDLSNFIIDFRYQRKGIAKSIIEMACGLDVDVIRIENIQNLAWAAKVREYTFKGRETVIDSDLGIVITVDFIRN